MVRNGANLRTNAWSTHARVSLVALRLGGNEGEEWPCLYGGPFKLPCIKAPLHET